MKLQTTGSLQVHGFQRKIKTGNMKLMLKDPQDKTAPEFYMKDAQKKFWRKLSSAERKKTIKKADIQWQKSDFYGTFQSEHRTCTGTFQKQRKGYRTDRIRDAPFSVQGNPIQTDRGQDIREELFTTFAEKKMPLLKLNAVQVSLEDVFMELTQSDKAAEEFARKAKEAEKEEVSNAGDL